MALSDFDKIQSQIDELTSYIQKIEEQVDQIMEPYAHLTS